MRRWMGALAVVAVVATGCGGASGASGANGTGNGDGKKADPQQAGLDFARCMREHGVDMPDPRPGEGGMVMIGPGPADGPDGGRAERSAGPPPGFEEADEACRHHLEGLLQDGDRSMDPAEQDRALRFARCMREHGVDMPDPDFSGGGISIRIAGDHAPEPETFKAAQKACGPLFGPGPGPAPGVGERARS